jgi:hypothetical protein
LKPLNPSDPESALHLCSNNVRSAAAADRFDSSGSDRQHELSAAAAALAAAAGGSVDESDYFCAYFQTFNDGASCKDSKATPCRKIVHRIHDVTAANISIRSMPEVITKIMEADEEQRSARAAATSAHTAPSTIAAISCSSNRDHSAAVLGFDSSSNRDRAESSREADAVLDCAAMNHAPSNQLISSSHSAAAKLAESAAPLVLDETRSTISGNRSSQHGDHHHHHHLKQLHNQHHRPRGHRSSGNDRRGRSSSPTSSTATTVRRIVLKHGYRSVAASTGAYTGPRDSKAASGKLRRRASSSTSTASAATSGRLLMPAVFQYEPPKHPRERTIFIIDQDAVQGSESVVAVVDRPKQEEAIVAERHDELLTCSSNDSGAAVSCGGIGRGSAGHEELAVALVTAEEAEEQSEQEQERRAGEESGTRSCSAEYYHVLDQDFAPPGIFHSDLYSVPFSDSWFSDKL